MNRAKCFYLVRLYSTALVVVVLIVVMGWSMLQNDYRKKAIEAFKAGDTTQLMIVLEEWSSKDPRFNEDPYYYLVHASNLLARGNLVAARYNLDKAMALMGK